MLVSDANSSVVYRGPLYILVGIKHVLCNKARIESALAPRAAQTLSGFEQYDIDIWVNLQKGLRKSEAIPAYRV